MADTMVGIGELARRAGVPVKTLRYWSDIDLVPPAERSAAGYRRYGEGERLRLEAVKTLRGLGFGIREIADVLAQRTGLRDSVALQLRAVEARIAELQRTAVVLRAALERTDEPTAAHLARLETLAQATNDERVELLDAFLDRVRDDGDTDDGWWDRFRGASLPRLPEAPTADQLDAWLELAELLADEDFRAALHDRAARAAADAPARRALADLMGAALAALQAGTDPVDPVADELVERLLAALGHAGDQPADVLARIARGDDPRMRRYWQLVNRVNARPPGPHVGDAFDWLVGAVRARSPL